MLACALLMLGCICFTKIAYAAPSDPVQQSSVGLEGVVPSAPPTTAATIAIPSNGQSFTSLPIKVSGLCSGDLLVRLFKNGVFSGSTQCANGSYSITTDFFNGTNELVAIVYDSLDQAGPESNKVTVTYTDTTFGNIGTRISLTSNFAKKGANPNEKLTWPFILSGGTQPYAVSINWGDGNTDLITRPVAGSFDTEHVYDKPGVYNILVKATDSTSASAFLQVVAIINGPLSQSDSSSSSGVVMRKIIIWWPMIIAGVMVCVSFWLGRRDKLRSLRKEAERRQSGRS